MKTPIQSAPLLLFSATLLLAAGCGGSSPKTITVTGGGGGGGGDDPPGPLLEIEPNDDALNADYIGEILGGDYLAIEGHVTECCPDPFDGFAFYALEPVEVVVTLSELDAGTDLDFALYDPYLDEIIAAWETDAHPEIGTFYYDGVGEFHLVVASYLGDSGYILELDVFPLDPVSYLSSGSGPGGQEPDARARERFRSYHVEPAPEPVQANLLVEEEEDGTLVTPLALPAPDQVRVR